MNNYEVTLIFNASFPDDEIKKLISKEEQLIKSLKGKIIDTEDWGRRKLTYIIKKQDTGYYFILVINLDSHSIKELENKLKVENKILRSQIIKIDSIKSLKSEKE